MISKKTQIHQNNPVWGCEATNFSAWYTMVLMLLSVVKQALTVGVYRTITITEGYVTLNYGGIRGPHQLYHLQPLYSSAQWRGGSAVQQHSVCQISHHWLGFSLPLTLFTRSSCQQALWVHSSRYMFRPTWSPCVSWLLHELFFKQHISGPCLIYHNTSLQYQLWIWLLRMPHAVGAMC